VHIDKLCDWFTLNNVVIHHEDPAKSAISAGARAAQLITLQDVTITQGLFNIHSDIYSRNQSPNIWQWILNNVTADELTLIDFVEYKLNAIKLSGCTIPTISWSQSLVYYNLYPTDPLFNQGFTQYGMYLYDLGGNNITTLSDITWTPVTNARSGQVLVSSAGSAVRFHVDLPVSCALVVVALPGNTGLVYIGNSGGDISSSTGLPLSAGESLRLINTCNLRELWLDAAVNGEGIAWA
jgi:hypothetical protein